MKAPDPYVYIIVRKDLASIMPEYPTVQSCHAAFESGAAFGRPEKPSYLILLAVENKDELVAAYEKLLGAGIRVVAFSEPDHSAGLTAIATEPLYTPAQKRLFEAYPLWKAPGIRMMPVTQAPPFHFEPT